MSKSMVFIWIVLLLVPSTVLLGEATFEEVAKLTAIEAGTRGNLGHSVSTDGTTAFVSAFNNSVGFIDLGHVYVFERDPGGTGSWGQVARLTSVDAIPGFGVSVSVDGTTGLVGAYKSSEGYREAGAAYVFERDAGGVWGQVATLTAADAMSLDSFGWSVSIDGTTAVVGAYEDDDGGERSGSAYIFERDAGGVGSWGQVAKLTASDADERDNFGWSVSIDGTTVLVGAQEDDDEGWNSGSAYIFERDAGGVGSWGQVAKLTASDLANNGRFGYSVSIDGTTALVGTNGRGSAYIFERDAWGAGSWGQVAKLAAVNAGGFGVSVSIDGATALIGAPGDDGGDKRSGSTYVFGRDAGGVGSWGQVAKLTASDAARDDRFGHSVSVAGATALLGARWDDYPPGEDLGSAYVFDIDPPEIGEDSRIARWPLDDAVGSVATDTSDNTLDGILVEEPAWSLGQDAGALTFDGSEDYVQVPASALLDLEDGLTLAAWVRPIPAAGAIQQILSKDNAYEFEIGNSLNPAAYSLRLNNIVAGAGTTPVEEGVWQHLAVTWDGTTVRYFYNGLEDGTATFNGPLDVTASDLGLGARPAPAIEGGPTFFLDGSLDDVRLFGSALSAEEIAEIVECTLSDIDPPVVTDRAPNSILSAGTASTALQLTTDTAAECRYTDGTDTTFASMAPFETTGGTDHSSTVSGLADDTLYTFAVRCQDTAGNTSSVDTVLFGIGHSDLTSGLVSHWSLDDATGCIAADGVGGNSLTLGPACPTDAPSFVDGVSGTGLDFTAAGHEVSVASPSGTSGVTALTLSAWVRHPSTAGNFRALIDQRDSGADGFDLYLDPGSRLFARFNSATATGSSTVADGIWHHVVAVYDGASTKLYVDGELEANVATSAGGIDTTAALFLGHHFASDDYTAQGQLDEVRIFDRALSTLEVVGLYLADRP